MPNGVAWNPSAGLEPVGHPTRHRFRRLSKSSGNHPIGLEVFAADVLSNWSWDHEPKGRDKMEQAVEGVGLAFMVVGLVGWIYFLTLFGRLVQAVEKLAGGPPR